jgi:hypothetical protein
MSLETTYSPGPIPGGLTGASTIEYAIEIGHMSNEGVVVLPVAGPVGTPASVVRMHSQIEYRSIVWSAARMGGVPKVPSWKAFIAANNTNVVFLGGVRTAQIPSPLVVGHWWILAGKYDYSLIVPEGLESAFKLGKMPWETQGVDENDIPAAFFDPLAILSAMPKLGIPAQLPTMIQG